MSVEETIKSLIEINDKQSKMLVAIMAQVTKYKTLKIIVNNEVQCTLVSPFADMYENCTLYANTKISIDLIKAVYEDNVDEYIKKMVKDDLSVSLFAYANRLKYILAILENNDGIDIREVDRINLIAKKFRDAVVTSINEFIIGPFNTVFKRSDEYFELLIVQLDIFFPTKIPGCLVKTARELFKDGREDHAINLYNIVLNTIKMNAILTAIKNI